MTVEKAVGLMLNNGINMMMINGKRNEFTIEYEQYIKHVKKALEDTSLFIGRVDQSVTKILQVKMAMGLVEVTKGGEKEEEINEQNAEIIVPEE